METASSLKRSTQAELSMCIICQQPKKDKMIIMGQQGVQTLRESAIKRHKLTNIKNRDVTDRILHEASNESLKCHNSTKPLLWELCMSCQTESKRETLRSVSTLETSTNIIEGATFDQKLCPALSGSSDLIAAEAKYHLSCYTSFKRKNIQDKRYSTGDHHSNGMAGWLAEELALNAHKLMDILWN